MKKFKLGKKIISEFSRPYFIAEIGVNYENSMHRAKKIIKLAKEAGADGVKFQSYKANKIACKQSPFYWSLKDVPIKSQYELFKKFDTFGYDQYKILKKYCDKLKIDFLSTPFDLEAVEYLDKLVPFFKVASADLTNYPLIEKICQKNKPIILSTGASNLQEIKDTLKFIKKVNKNIKVVILHCILSYPTSNKDAYLGTIKSLKKEFKNNFIGYSDHTLPDENMIILTNSYVNGARVIEKHFTDKKGVKGNDHFHSLDKNDLIKFKNNISLIIETNLAQKQRKVLKCELKSRKNARRSIVTLGVIAKGETFTKENLIMKRPGTGLCPTTLNQILGKKSKRKLPDDHILKKIDID